MYCAKCGRSVSVGDRFCSSCGSSDFIEKTQRKIGFTSMVYGPPFRVSHECEKCGYVLFESGLGSPRAEFCPKCGKKYPKSER